MKNFADIEIYTDGACSGNPGPGGWGAYIIYNGGNLVEEKISGCELNTTNNRMELTAAIKGLDHIKERRNIKVYTDSIYVKNGITIWIHNWLKNGWIASNKSQVKNVDLWQQLDELTKFHNISWHWIRGHSNNRGNVIADKLAVNAKNEIMP